MFHISKEQIRAYYHGWVLGKGSVWKDEIGTHILECAQVVLEVKKKSQAYVFIHLQVRQDNVSGLFEGSKRHKNGPTD